MSTLTARLGGLIRRFRTSQPVEVEARRNVAETAQSLEQLVEEPATIESDHSADSGGHDREPAAKGGLLSRLPGSRRDAAMGQLQEGFNEMVGLIRDVRSHMDQQAERSERMLGLLEKLPEAIESLPETNRNQSRMLEAMNSHLEQTGKQSQQLQKTLQGLANANEHQGQVMGLIQQQVENTHKTEQQMLSSFSSMNQTLQQLSESALASSQAMSQFSQQAYESDQRMDQLVRRTNRQTIILWATSWVVGLAAIGLAAYALIVG